MNVSKAPVVFIHSLWLHAISWGPWVDLFREAGYEPAAPGWPGDADTVEAARAKPDSIAGHGIGDVTSHYQKIIDQLPDRPIIIGHSFGGMIAEKLLGQDYGGAAIAIDAAQIEGVLAFPLSSLRSTLPVLPHSPDEINTANEGRGPLLLIMGGQDHTMPETITKSTLKQYRHSSAVTDLEEFEDRGHSLTIDSGWREVGDTCLAWLATQGL